MASLVADYDSDSDSDSNDNGSDAPDNVSVEFSCKTKYFSIEKCIIVVIVFNTRIHFLQSQISLKYYKISDVIKIGQH